MTQSHLLNLAFAYHFDLLDRLMGLASKLEKSDYQGTDEYSHGSIHETLFHVLRADRSWRIGLETGSRPGPLNPEDFSNLAALLAQREAEANAWRAMLSNMSAAEFSEVISLKSGAGRELKLDRETIILHVMLHGMQHIAEVAERLTRLGQSPGSIDFLYYAAGI